MQISPINYKFNFNNRYFPNRHTAIVQQQTSFSVVQSSNIFYLPVFEGKKREAKRLVRNEKKGSSEWFENRIVKQVKGKKYQGAGLYDKSGMYVDFLKIGNEKLFQEPLDITKATDKEVYAYWHALALAETYDSSWVGRYNKFNITKPLAVFHTLNSEASQELFAQNLRILHNPVRCKSLDTNITDEQGNLCINCSVFDTETTGTKTDEDNLSDNDRIVQIGAVQIKNGKISKKSEYNQLINPEIPIPEEATAVHGITDADVENAEKLEAVLSKFLDKYLNKENGVIVAYNSKFDIKLLNNAIREHNTHSDKRLKERPTFKVLDPFILIQRIHPYLGVKKKLSGQYQFLFSKNLEEAHDALADVKGTVDVLKYCLYYLNEHRRDKSVPLTLREVLIFQNGGRVKNIDLPMDVENCNAAVNFNKSYLLASMNVDNYFKGYKLSKEIVDSIKDEIGDVNIQKLVETGIINEKNILTHKGFKINPAETKRIPKSAKYENSFYILKSNFKEVLGFADLEPYNGKTKDEIEDLIIEKSKLFLHKQSMPIWMKNPNPMDIKDGNDLPDLKIARKVMAENKEAENL
ncbi:MAG TPA: 3'-5' exonuclease [Candidatus Gastranaerophilaceae bacterium]|nr:3'-5' exonuclease [Candidatus Gastranaerophilaceae bacterium]HPT41648.1 3'-5' exonuclease [Candidatus Gastranaerophilaceae bacterium]